MTERLLSLFSEAEYAFEKQRHIIPLKLQTGYKPDGWLGFIWTGKYFYDFSRQELHKDKLTKLLEAIRKAFRTKPEDCTDGLVQGEHPQRVEDESALVVCLFVIRSISPSTLKT